MSPSSYQVLIFHSIKWQTVVIGLVSEKCSQSVTSRKMTSTEWYAICPGIAEHYTKLQPNPTILKNQKSTSSVFSNSYEAIKSVADHLLQKVKHRPKIGIICGTGLGSLADDLGESQVFEYADIPHFPVSTVKGHGSRLVFGLLGGVEVVCMQGRFHFFEGYPLWKCVMPVRILKLMGVTHLIVTNASGGLNPNFKCGDIMIIKDHINFPGFGGNNPLIGSNDERFGPRFPPMNKAYDAVLRKEANRIALDLGLKDIIQEGVYAYVNGPNFETVAELVLLKTVGADAVGMSTVPEVITANHCGLTIFGISLITNVCVMDHDSKEEANHEEVLDVGKLRGPELKKILTGLVVSIHNKTSDR